MANLFGSAEYDELADKDPKKYYKKTPFARSLWEGRLPTWLGQAYKQDIEPAIEKLPSPTTMEGALTYAKMPYELLKTMATGATDTIKSSMDDPTNAKKSLELALMTSGAGGLLGRVPKGPGKVLGMFGGRAAKTADLGQMKKAEKMLDGGADRADVWKQTGWMRGPDGKMRFEIDDSAARLDMDAIPPSESRLDLARGYSEAKYGSPAGKMFTGKNPARDKEALKWADENIHLAREGETTMAAALTHGDAFAAYPDAKKIRLGKTTGKAKGTFDPDSNRIKVGGGVIGRSPDEHKSTALHELQHAVQQQEGFARGGNHGEAVESLLRGRNAELNKLSKAMDGRQSELGLSGYRPKTDDSVLNTMRQRYDYLQETNPATDEAAYEWYKRLAGEAEARNVQTRMDYSPEQRVAKPPWTTLDVPEADQIVRMKDGGTKMALPIDEASRIAKREKITALRAEANANRDDWAGIHRPPMRDSGAPAHDLTGGGTVYPDDVYSPNAVQYYGTGNKAMDRETVQILNKLKNNPDKMVSIYRAVPPGVKGSEISAGDWVTVNRNYAKDHGESSLMGDYVIIERRVPARDIYTNGDSIHEFGFDPSRESMIDALR